MGIAERKERERRMRRDMILRASEEVFFEKGLRAATLDDVAERAEVSKGTIYLYFASKEDLYYSLMTRGLSMLLATFEEARPDMSDPKTALRQLSDSYLKFSREQSYLFKILAAVDRPVVSGQVSQGVFSELENISDKVLSYVARFVQQGIDAGKFRTDLSSYEAVILFWVSLSGILNLSSRAEALRANESVNKNSVLCQVNYDRLYDKCVTFLMNLFATREPRSPFSREVVKKTKKH